MWKARVVQWQNAGISVQAIAPSEGALAYVSGFVIPKNAPNKEGSYAYLDAMLEKSAQEAFAIDMGYNPTVTNAVVAPDLNERIGFTPDEIKALVDLDYALHDAERRRPQGVVGQGAQGLMRSGAIRRRASRRARERRSVQSLSPSSATADSPA